MISKIKKYFKLKFDDLKPNPFDYINCFSDKRQQVNAGIEKIYEKLDVLFIVKKLIEVDKLKHILLD